MKSLPIVTPSTEDKFRDGLLVIDKARRKQLGLAIDHAHEQNNDLLMSDGCAVDLTENLGVLRRLVGRWSRNVKIIQTSRLLVSAIQMLQKSTCTHQSLHQNVTSLVETRKI